MKSTKIRDYVFASSLLAESSKDAYCTFKLNDELRVGIIEYIAKSGDTHFLQIQPIEAQNISNLFINLNIPFQSYFRLGEKVGNLIICDSSAIVRKGIIVSTSCYNYFVPLAHVFEHN